MPPKTLGSLPFCQNECLAERGQLPHVVDVEEQNLIGFKCKEEVGFGGWIDQVLMVSSGSVMRFENYTP